MRKLLTAIAASLFAFSQTGVASYSDNEIRIALMTDFSGIYARLGGMGTQIAAELAIEDMGGKVAGRPIRLYPIDTRVDPEHALAEAERLRKEEGIDAFLDMIGSNVSIALQEYARQHNIAALHTSSAASTLTNDRCSEVGVHWTYDSYALAAGTVRAMLRHAGPNWFFLGVDDALGRSLTEDAQSVLDQFGGSSVGRVFHPFRSADLTSEVTAARESGADVVALASAGGDLVNGIRQAYEFGVFGSRQKVVALINFLDTVQRIGPYAAHGLIFTTAFYWDYDEDTRAWSKRFMARSGMVPDMLHAGAYSGLLHYLKAVAAAGTDDARKVVAKMKELPIDDVLTHNARLRVDGRMVHDIYLVQVKGPAETKGRGDYLDILEVIPGEQAFRPLSESRCSLINPS